RLRINERPRLPGILRTIKPAARLCFDERINSIRLGCGNREVCFTNQLGRQPAGDLCEVLTAVSALVETSLARAADDCPRFPFEMRHPGIHDIWVTRLQLNVHRTDAVRDEQNFAPCLPAVSCLEHAAFG